MNKLLAMVAGVVVTSAFAVGEAQALPTQVVSYVFYSGTQAIGQSIRFCNGVAQHWGTAQSNNLANAVAVTYSCDSNDVKSVGYGANVDPWVRQNFCAETNICAPGPEWITGAPGPFESGLYSN
ncbi:hypothetical protein L2Y94_19975 [Luteibacter aegosomatis]|uniref:hypothetical protein n=1 Tax=Luteibacter aegosomatis TaxID=2911537 RepID=UPI001FFA0C99|nr:hypothetical protein [Luteibacter aegosomatis]UPG85548.1 hypothetical protein L2Y94_19975 [Luteibacter aegosomatis]